jgi:methyltransferase (TIGR00027 family)
MARRGIRRGSLAPSYHYVVARTPYIDGCLKQCVDDGIEQLVILGAGFDSRAYRVDELMDGVKVFEVDHPATQELKIERVKEALGALPENVVYVSVDFEREELGERLLAGGYDPGVKTLFIWEGVVSYLTPEAVDGTLSFIAGNAVQGSSIVFTYTFRSVIEGSVGNADRRHREYLKRKGEPHIFGLDEAAIDEFLSSRGFALVENVTGRELVETYIRSRDRGEKAFSHSAVARATVKPGPSREP